MRVVMFQLNCITEVDSGLNLTHGLYSLPASSQIKPPVYFSLEPLSNFDSILCSKFFVCHMVFQLCANLSSNFFKCGNRQMFKFIYMNVQVYLYELGGW